MLNCYIEHENGQRMTSDCINICDDDVRFYCDNEYIDDKILTFVVNDSPQTDHNDNSLSQCVCRISYHGVLPNGRSQIDAKFGDSLCTSRMDDVTNRRAVCSYEKTFFNHELHASLISYGQRVLSCLPMVSCASTAGSLMFRGNDNTTELQLGVSFVPADVQLISLGTNFCVFFLIS